MILFAGGCVKRGFDRGAIGQSVYSAPDTITDDDIRQTLERKPQIRFPFRLGVYFSTPYYSHYSRHKSGWAGEERDIEWIKQLTDEGIVSEVIPITSATITRNDKKEQYLKSVRIAAARHNADAVLIVDYSYDVDRYNNFSAFLYLTIVGGYFIPGTHSDALVIMNGALWDVRNEYLYLTVETEGEANRIGPAFLLEDKVSVESAKEKALKDFREELIRRMRNLKG
ncbi:hypothetical protein [Desulfonema ishimotonii]|uniref:hypothetical protein n=1 Tax=Desulfonema ishimotonii TaxID=45657 RepID=UPI000F585ADB|nr:hypothetical protein [Desulfonema ishimotonii]